jgi:hypothetical protein
MPTSAIRTTFTQLRDLLKVDIIFIFYCHHGGGSSNLLRLDDRKNVRGLM